MSTACLERPDDTGIDRKIGVLLRTGVILSAIVIALGGILYLVHSGETVVSYHHFSGAPQQLRSIPEIVNGALGGDGLSIIQFGILLLIATPVARVAFSVLAFFFERDWLYVGISCVVLAVLLYSLSGHAQ